MVWYLFPLWCCVSCLKAIWWHFTGCQMHYENGWYTFKLYSSRTVPLIQYRTCVVTVIILISGTTTWCVDTNAPVKWCDMSCAGVLGRVIQTMQADLIRLSNTNTCDDTGFRNGACICGDRLQSIPDEVVERCVGKSSCSYLLIYSNSDDCLGHVGPPFLLKITYECGWGT